jgi:hypothetical protein
VLEGHLQVCKQWLAEGQHLRKLLAVRLQYSVVPWLDLIVLWQNHLDQYVDALPCLLMAGSSH